MINKTIIVPEQIKAVRFNVFASYYFMSQRGFLERFEVELSRPCAAGVVFGFCPPTDGGRPGRKRT